jgi:hypothetical protein
MTGAANDLLGTSLLNIGKGKRTLPIQLTQVDLKNEWSVFFFDQQQLQISD